MKSFKVAVALFVFTACILGGKQTWALDPMSPTLSSPLSDTTYDQGTLPIQYSIPNGETLLSGSITITLSDLSNSNNNRTLTMSDTKEVNCTLTLANLSGCADLISVSPVSSIPNGNYTVEVSYYNISSPNPGRSSPANNVSIGSVQGPPQDPPSSTFEVSSPAQHAALSTVGPNTIRYFLPSASGCNSMQFVLSDGTNFYYFPLAEATEGNNNEDTILLDDQSVPTGSGYSAVVQCLDGDGNALSTSTEVTELDVFTPTLTVSDVIVDEGAGVAEVVIELSHQMGNDVVVSYDTFDDTAENGSDYDAVTDTLTWTTGESGPKVIEIPITDDSDIESDEVFNVILGANEFALFDNSSDTKNITVTITDNDGEIPAEPGVTFSTDSLEVTEDGAGGSYEISLNSQPTANVTIDIFSDNDYVDISPDSITFTTENWDTPQTITVSAISDGDTSDPVIAFISHELTSEDSNYDGVVDGDITLTINNVDVEDTGEDTGSDTGGSNTGSGGTTSSGDDGGDNGSNGGTGTNTGTVNVNAACQLSPAAHTTVFNSVELFFLLGGAPLLFFTFIRNTYKNTQHS